MVLALLLSLAAVAQDQPSSAPPIRVQLNHEQFTTGDRAKVFVETARDGHLVVLHADAEGRVRVLFPLDPTDDDFVRAGRRQELRSRSDREAFVVDAEDGSGTVLAAVATDPFDYAAFVRNAHWDFRALGGPNSVRDDPLAGLLDIVQRMAGTTRFEYDAATYVVSPRRVAHYGYGYGLGYPYRYRYYSSFYDPFCYDSFWGWRSSCYGYGYGFGYPYGYRPRQFGFNRFGSGGFTRNWPRFVIPPRDGRDRYTPVQPRPRPVSPSAQRPVGPSAPRPVPPPAIRDTRSSRPQPRAAEPRGRDGSRPAARPSGGRRRP